ncbi:MAG: MarR family transcriptional regulator [Microscillaceae bacterium]|nr:MarR family transcriptional regulator [Microscillaceae bacterium]
MKIEEEIQQSKFRNEFQKLAINLLFTANWLDNKHRDFLKEYDITVQQFNVLRILRGQHPKPVSVSDIRQRMIDKMSDVSRIVERLRLQGLLSRVECEQDRRLVDVTITDKGLELLALIDQRMDDMELVLHQVSESEAKVLNELLDKMRE